ncbi:MAG: AAA family ATPase [Rhodospirillales bacterium]|nr:AAA family ATPase [Alphaproteobacteria bacterium]MBL6948467.1 AAA family ATPase [Rhodospirillales bacterium]
MKKGVSLSSPFLKRITLLSEKVDRGLFPFNRFPNLLDDEFSLDFPTPVTFFTGENGTGKSTVLEAIAKLCGFHLGGGGSDHQLHETSDQSESVLADFLRPSWLPKVSKGFFFRSDTFSDVARYLDDEGNSAGGRLHEQSHGESLLSLFAYHFGTSERCIYLLDEPENALSPTRQMSFLRLLRDWEDSCNAQMIVATHSPIIMSYPGATILSFDGESVEPIEYKETEHYRITKAFLGNPERYLAELFEDEPESY